MEVAKVSERSMLNLRKSGWLWFVNSVLGGHLKLLILGNYCILPEYYKCILPPLT